MDRSCFFTVSMQDRHSAALHENDQRDQGKTVVSKSRSYVARDWDESLASSQAESIGSQPVFPKFDSRTPASHKRNVSNRKDALEGLNRLSSMSRKDGVRCDNACSPRWRFLSLERIHTRAESTPARREHRERKCWCGRTDCCDQFCCSMRAWRTWPRKAAHRIFTS